MTHSSLPLVITWSDLCTVWHKYRKWMLRVVIVSAIAGTIGALLLPARYTAKALFREGSASSPLSGAGLPSIFSTMISSSSDGNSLVLLQSDSVLKVAVQNLGLQITPYTKKTSFPLANFLRRLYRGALLHCGIEQIEKTPFLFSDVEFANEEALRFSLIFNDEKNFTLQDLEGTVLSTGTLGQKIYLPEASFSLQQAPSDFVIGKSYPFQIIPWEAAVASIRAGLEIRPEKLEKSLLRLFYSSSQREQSVRVLDGIMTAYLQYLQEEHNRLAAKQLSFLNEHQGQFTDKFEKELDEYLACLKQNISEYGFFEVEQEVEIFAKRQNELKSKLIDLDRLFNRLKKAQASYISAAKSEPLKESNTPSIVPAHNVTEPLLAAAKMARNRTEQFAGIDLDTAEKLHAEYQKEEDHCQEHIDRISFLLSRIHHKDFDLNALGALVNDPVTANLINRASDLSLQGKDVTNRSQKDLLRIEDSLAAQKAFIAQHLSQSLELHKQNSLIAQSKLERLREVMMTLVETEKAGIYSKLKEIRELLSELPARWKLEKQLHFREDMMGKMISGIAQMIEGKTIEHRLRQLSSKIIDPAICSSAPKKVSFPLFLAVFMGVAIALVYIFFFCRLLLRGFPLSEATARALELATSGTVGPNCDVPLQDLNQRDVKTIRTLANFIQEKKGSEGAVVALTGNRRPIFLHNLARFLSMRDERVLIIDASFDFAQHQGEEGSLWQYLHDESSAWQPQKNDGFDTLASGATGRFCTELLHKERFAQLLTKARCEYDIVLLVFSSVLDVNEAGVALGKMDAHIVTLQEESIEQLERIGLTERLRQSASATIVFQTQ